MKKCPKECKLVLMLLVTSKSKIRNWKFSGGEIQTTARSSCFLLSSGAVRRAKSTLQKNSIESFLMMLYIFTSSLGRCILKALFLPKLGTKGEKEKNIEKLQMCDFRARLLENNFSSAPIGSEGVCCCPNTQLWESYMVFRESTDFFFKLCL